MAVDSKDDDDVGEDSIDEELPLERKVRRARNLSKSQKTVEGALDDFIARANEKLLDVSEFDHAAKEQAYKKEIDELKKKLADAESRSIDAAVTNPRGAKAAVVAPPPEPVEPERIVETKTNWGMVIGAFVLGCAGMFAFNLATKDTAAPTQMAQPQPTTTQPTTMQPATQPTAEPIAQPPPQSTQTVEQPAQPTTTEPPQPTQTAEAPKQPKQPKQPAQQPKQPKQPKQPTTNTTTTNPPDTQQPKPPPQPQPQQGSGSGELYNPF
jgi:hypothetical protein